MGFDSDATVVAAHAALDELGAPAGPLVERIRWALVPPTSLSQIEQRGHGRGDIGTVVFPNGSRACATDPHLLAALVIASRDLHLNKQGAS